MTGSRAPAQRVLLFGLGGDEDGGHREGSVVGVLVDDVQLDGELPAFFPALAPAVEDAVPGERKADPGAEDDHGRRILSYRNVAGKRDATEPGAS